VRDPSLTPSLVFELSFKLGDALQRAALELFGDRGRSMLWPADLAARLTEPDRCALREVEAPDVRVGHRDTDATLEGISLEQLPR
jgi:hypothetical protein